MDHGVKMASIGTQAYYPKITADLRNIPLNETADLLAGAKLAIGPSSGPMHLASLCGTRHIVWTDDKFWSAAKMNNRTRYESMWNPLKTPCTVVDQYGWDPPVAVITSLVLKGLEEWSNRPKL
jgi:ADP-heptose:LPS heptosyltransferase